MAKKGYKTTGSEGQMPSMFDRAVEWVLSHEGPHPYKPEEIWTGAYDEIKSDPLAFKVFDMAMDPIIGPERAYAFLQAALRKDFGYYDPEQGVDISGMLDSRTVIVANSAVALFGEQQVIEKVIARAEIYHRSLVDLRVPLKRRLRRLLDMYELVPDDAGAEPNGQVETEERES